LARSPLTDLDSPSVGDVVEANLALTRRGYELWNTGGVQAMIDDVYAPDVVYHDLPEFPDAGVFCGIAAVATRLGELVEAMGVVQMDLRSLEGRGEYVLAAIEVSAEGVSSGAAMTTPLFHVFRGRGSRFSEVRAYLNEDQARREYERLATVSSG
jgi:hypothetical protein